MQAKPYVLWLIWQNENTRQRYHVGTLIHKENQYIFKFEKEKKHRGLYEARDNGYFHHLAFPDIDKIYVSSELFGPFAKRVPNEHRPDFDQILQSYGLSSDFTKMDLLRVTGGRLGTDSYEFVSPIYLYENGQFEFDFYIAGWRHWNDKQDIYKIDQSTKLFLKKDSDNPEDPHAISVNIISGKKLGYIPAFYSEFMDEVLQNKCSYDLTILSIHPQAIPQRNVHVYLKGNVNKKISAHYYNGVRPLQLL